MNVDYYITNSIVDIIDLLMLRVDIFVREQAGPHDEEPDVYDREATFVVARADGTIIGTARFRDVDGKVKIERIAVRKDLRGSGVGRGLVEFILHHIRDRRSVAVYLHAQVVAEDFYRKLGFEPVGETFMEAGIEHILMVREV